MSDVQEKVETTTVSDSPQQVIKTTTHQAEPPVKTEAPQKVFNKKKTIFRSNQIIWYILGLLEVLLIFRVALKALGANPSSGFTSFIYTLTGPFADPFRGIFRITNTESYTLEWSSLVAAIVYLCIAWGLLKLLELFFPITPNDVERQ